MINVFEQVNIMNYYTVKQVAEELGITAHRVRMKILLPYRKCFPGAKKPGNEWFIPKDEVMKEKEYMDKRRKKL